MGTFPLMFLQKLQIVSFQNICTETWTEIVSTTHLYVRCTEALLYLFTLWSWCISKGSRGWGRTSPNHQ